MFKYAQYFAVRHPKVIEDEKAVEVVLNLDDVDETPSSDEKAQEPEGTPITPLRKRGRTMTAEFVDIPIVPGTVDESLSRTKTSGGSMGRMFSVKMKRGRSGTQGAVEVPLRVV